MPIQLTHFCRETFKIPVPAKCAETRTVRLSNDDVFSDPIFRIADDSVFTLGFTSDGSDHTVKNFRDLDVAGLIFDLVGDLVVLNTQEIAHKDRQQMCRATSFACEDFGQRFGRIN